MGIYVSNSGDFSSAQRILTWTWCYLFCYWLTGINAHGMLALRELGARCRQATGIDARIGVNATLASAAWFALARGVLEGPLRPKRITAHVPGRLAKRRAPVFGEVIRDSNSFDVLSQEVSPTDLLLLALPAVQLQFALQLHAQFVRHFLVIVGIFDCSNAGISNYWEEMEGDWPTGLTVLNRILLGPKAWNGMLPLSSVVSYRMTIISMIGDGHDFQDHLGASPLYKERDKSPHSWLIVPGPGGKPLSQYVSELRMQAEGEFSSELLLFAHPDIYLPASFEKDLLGLVERLDTIDPSWAMAGFFGVPLDWEPEPPEWPWSRTRVVGRGKDMYGRYAMAASNLTAVQCLDESLMLFRSAHSHHPSPLFDINLPSSERLWLGGTSVILEGLAQGRKSYALGVEVLHKIWGKTLAATIEQRKRFTRKILNPEYAVDYVVAMKYMSLKYIQSRLVSKEKVYAYFWEFDADTWTYIPLTSSGPIS